jgi:hypothetical protein
LIEVAAGALSPLDARLAPPPFESPGWLRGGHAQTIWPYLLPRPAVRYRRERVEAPDGDFWDFDWLDAPETSRTPLVALFHGLEGSSDSHYARALMALLAQRGWRGVIPHFRGCSGEPNRLPRAYHSGDHPELESQIAAIRAAFRRRRSMPSACRWAAAFSSTGSAGSGPMRRVTAAAAVSTRSTSGRASPSAGPQPDLHAEFPEHSEAERTRDGAGFPVLDDERTSGACARCTVR